MKLKKLLISATFLLFINYGFAQTYNHIVGWSKKMNNEIYQFLETTKLTSTPKIAVFDFDGTIFGQTPYYIADEVICTYAIDNYIGKENKSAEKSLKHLNNTLHNKKDPNHTIDRVYSFAGAKLDEIQNLSWNVYQAKYQDKAYPEMQQLIANLYEYGFEIWVITGSPSVIYGKIASKIFGIPDSHIIGANSVIYNGVISDEIIPPVTMNNGKLIALETFIREKPLLIGGNSRGDIEMVQYSQGLKLMINPDNTKKYSDSLLKNQSIQEFCEENNILIGHCKDIGGKLSDFNATKFKANVNTNTP
ncbi:MAG: HAD family hydrolase [Bacteroidales bacterium]